MNEERSGAANVQRSEALWRASSVRLHAWFARHTGSTHDADDLVQETFLRVQRALGSVRDEERVAGWLGAIAANVLADRGRRRAREADSLERDPDPTAAGAPEPAAREEEPELASVVAGWLDEFLARIDPADAALLRAVDLEGRTQADVARDLGLSASGARSRVQRARARLRAELEACCRFAFDRRGGLTDATRRDGTRCGCDDC